MSNAKAITRKQAVHKLWELGRISEMKMHKGQMSVKNKFESCDDRIFVLNSSRRWGKSYFLVCMAIEYALKHPDAQLRYAAPSAKMVKKIITPLIRQIISDCPKSLKPKYRSQENVWVFTNGAEIHVAGTDNGRAEALRGTSMDLGIIDEAGFVDDLKYVVNDILMPQTLTTGGRILLASTPSRSPDHPYKDYVEEAQRAGAYMSNTIFDNPLISKKDVEDAIKYAGGRHTDTFRREYMAEFIIDQEYAVIPEFNAEAREELVKDVERPPFFDAYVAMDVGFVDHTAVLFGYWDFNNAVLVIEDELILDRITTDRLAQGIKAKEERLWGHKPPFMRISDVDPIVIADLISSHGLVFTQTQKDNKEAAVNALRVMVANRQIYVNPRCENLIAQLGFAIWNKHRSSFERSADHGHYDTVDALIYLVRNISRNKNPHPHKYEGIGGPNWVLKHSGPPRTGSRVFLDLFTPSKYRKS